MKRRLPRGIKIEYAERAVELGITRKNSRQLLHLWLSDEKRRTHKRERREGKKQIRDDT